MSEQVYVASSHVRGHRRYHTDKECEHLTDNPKERDKEMVDAWGYALCQYCSGEVTQSNTGKSDRTQAIHDYIEEQTGSRPREH